MKSNISLQQVLIVLLVVGLLPSLLVGVYLKKQFSNLDVLTKSLSSLKEKEYQLKKREAINHFIQDKYTGKDNKFLDELKNLSFLDMEKKSLEHFIEEHPAENLSTVKQRVAFLNSSDNRLAFEEESVEKYTKFQEKIDKMVHPVEIDMDDLYKVLAHIEGVQFGPYSPPEERLQTMLLNFSLQRNLSAFDNETYILNMTLLSREFSAG